MQEISTFENLGAFDPGKIFNRLSLSSVTITVLSAPKGTSQIPFVGRNPLKLGTVTVTEGLSRLKKHQVKRITACVYSKIESKLKDTNWKSFFLYVRPLWDVSFAIFLFKNVINMSYIYTRAQAYIIQL